MVSRTNKILAALATVGVVLLCVRIVIMRSFDKPLGPPLSVIGELPVTLPDGDSATLANSLRPGLPTVVTLWASWCEPCQREARCCQSNRNSSPIDTALPRSRNPQPIRICHSARAAERRSL